MEFRRIALIALWTLLSGPVFNQPYGTTPAPETQNVRAEPEQHTER